MRFLKSEREKERVRESKGEREKEREELNFPLDTAEIGNKWALRVGCYYSGPEKALHKGLVTHVSQALFVA